MSNIALRPRRERERESPVEGITGLAVHREGRFRVVQRDMKIVWLRWPV